MLIRMDINIREEIVREYMDHFSRKHSVKAEMDMSILQQAAEYELARDERQKEIISLQEAYPELAIIAWENLYYIDMPQGDKPNSFNIRELNLRKARPAGAPINQHLRIRADNIYRHAVLEEAARVKSIQQAYSDKYSAMQYNLNSYLSNFTSLQSLVRKEPLMMQIIPARYREAMKRRAVRTKRPKKQRAKPNPEVITQIRGVLAVRALEE